MHRRCCRPAASSVHYTTSCKHSLVLLRMGEIIARNILNWFKLLIQLLLFHLVGCLYYCISDARSHKHKKKIRIVWSLSYFVTITELQGLIFQSKIYIYTSNKESRIPPDSTCYLWLLEVEKTFKKSDCNQGHSFHIRKQDKFRLNLNATVLHGLLRLLVTEATIDSCQCKSYPTYSRQLLFHFFVNV